MIRTLSILILCFGLIEGKINPSPLADEIYENLDYEDGRISAMLSLDSPSVTLMAYDGLDGTQDETIIYLFDTSNGGIQFAYLIPTNLTCHSNLFPIEGVLSSSVEIGLICAPRNHSVSYQLSLLRIEIVNSTFMELTQTTQFPVELTIDIQISSNPSTDLDSDSLFLANNHGQVLEIDLHDFSYSILINNLTSTLLIEGASDFVLRDYFFLSKDFGVFVIAFPAYSYAYDAQTVLFTWSRLLGVNHVAGTGYNFESIGSMVIPPYQGYIVYEDLQTVDKNLTVQTWDFQKLVATDTPINVGATWSKPWSHRNRISSLFFIGTEVDGSFSFLTQYPESGGVITSDDSRIGVNATGVFSVDSRSAYVGYLVPGFPGLFGTARYDYV